MPAYVGACLNAGQIHPPDGRLSCRPALCL